MSKLIVEMEMPRNCDECEANHDCAFCGITGSMFYGNTQMPDFMPDEKKLPDCPIKGVLPEEHGDLVDRDEVKQKMIHYGFRAIDMTATEFCEDELQTVIAAER